MVTIQVTALVTARWNWMRETLGSSGRLADGEPLAGWTRVGSVPFRDQAGFQHRGGRAEDREASGCGGLVVPVLPGL